MNNPCQKFLEVCHTVLPQAKERFQALHEPSLKEKELLYVKECVETGWVSSVGKFVDQFELDLAKTCEVNRAIAVSSGTAALHLCLLAAGVCIEHEVLVPSLTFVATANAISYTSATPHFVDCESDSLGVDPCKLEEYLQKISTIKHGFCVNKTTGKTIKALVVMHAFGHPSQLDELKNVTEKYNIVLIEDAAESMGSLYKGSPTGGHGLLSAVSFNGNKILTTGGGGAVLTNDEKLADYVKHISTTAKQKHAWDYVHDTVAYNYRMPNINAALGVAQLQRLSDLVEKKRVLANQYQEAFQAFDEAEFLVEPSYSKSNYWLISLKLRTPSLLQDILKVTNTNNIMTRPIWKPMHQLKMYERSPKMNLDCTEDLYSRCINLPSSASLLES